MARKRSIAPDTSTPAARTRTLQKTCDLGKLQCCVTEDDPLGFLTGEHRCALGRLRTVLKAQEKDWRAEGEVALVTSGEPGVYVTGEFTGLNQRETGLSAWREWKGWILENQDGASLGGRAYMCLNGDRGKTTVIWKLPEPFTFTKGGDETVKAARVTATVFDLDVDMGSIKKTELEHGGWKVQVKTVGRIPEDPREDNWNWVGARWRSSLEASRDGKLFSRKEASHLLDGLKWFLTFANSARASLPCSSGWGNGGEHVWLSVSGPPKGGERLMTWRCRGDARALSELFPGFMKQWEGGWKETFKIAVERYAEANDKQTSLGGRVIAAAVALERLAHQRCTEELKMIGRGSFKKLYLSEQIRCLLVSMQIPTRHQDASEELQNVMKDRRLQDGAHALGEVRNLYAHGETGEYSNMDTNERRFVWEWAVQAVELAMLALCGYKGLYEDRATGETKVVPWVTRN